MYFRTKEAFVNKLQNILCIKKKKSNSPSSKYTHTHTQKHIYIFSILLDATRRQTKKPAPKKCHPIVWPKSSFGELQSTKYCRQSMGATNALRTYRRNIRRPFRLCLFRGIRLALDEINFARRVFCGCRNTKRRGDER